MFNADGIYSSILSTLIDSFRSRSRFCEFLLRFRGAVDASSTFGTFLSISG